MERVSGLAAVEAELGRCRGRRGAAVLDRWGRACGLLGRAELDSPGDVPSWVWSLHIHAADGVLRVLVELAQGGDREALLVVLACLRPGLLALVKSAQVGLDDIVSEAAVVVLSVPITKRRRVAAGLLLDVRHRFWAAKQRVPELLLGDVRRRLENIPAPGELGVEPTAAERVFDLVSGAVQSGDLGEDVARLILETRLLGDTVAVAAARRGINAKAAFERRRRAEARLARASGDLVIACLGMGLGRSARTRGHGVPSRRSTYCAQGTHGGRPNR